MLSLKSILNESPDAISIPAMHGGSDDPDDLDLMEFQDARFTFLAYHDRRDDKTQWVAFDYRGDGIISSSPGLQEDLYGKRGTDYDNDNIDRMLDRIGDFPAHHKIRDILYAIDRLRLGDVTVLDGRLYEHKGNW